MSPRMNIPAAAAAGGADALLWPDDRGRLRLPARAVAGVVAAAGRRGGPLALTVYDGVVCLWAAPQATAALARDFVGRADVAPLADGTVLIDARHLAAAGLSGWSARTLTVWPDEVNVT